MTLNVYKEKPIRHALKKQQVSDCHLNQGDFYGSNISNMYADELFRQRIGVVLPFHKDR